MTVQDVLWLFKYTDWANDRTTSSIEKLSEEQFVRPIGGSFANIRDTAAHMASAEWIWMRRFHGVSPTAMPDWAVAPTATLLRLRLHEIQVERTAFLAALQDADLHRAVAYRRLNGAENSQPLGHLLQHVANHSTYHRGQIATMIRQVGGTPIGTDLMNFTG